MIKNKNNKNVKLIFIKLLYLVIPLIMSCPMPNEDNNFSIRWDSSKCRVFINEVEINDGEYSVNYGRGTKELTIKTIANENDGWFFYSYDFYQDGFPHGAYYSEKENSFTFEVSSKYRDCTIYLNTYSLDSVYNKTNDSLFFSVSYPNIESFYKYFSYDLQNETLLEIDQNQFIENNKSEFDYSDVNEDFIVSKNNDSTKSIIIPGTWSDLNTSSIESNDKTKAIIGVTNDLFNETSQTWSTKYNYYIWDYNNNELIELDVHKKIDSISWSISDDSIYFSDESTSSLNLNEAIYTSNIERYDLVNHGFSLIKTYSKQGIFTINLFNDYYIYDTWGNGIFIYDYANTELLFINDCSSRDVVGYNKEKNELYLYIKNQTLYQVGDSDLYKYIGDIEEFYQITSYDIIK